MSEVDLKKLLKRAVELCMPDLRHYYRLPRKGRVVKSYASDGQYWADVQPLRNDESDDANEPVISRVEIPILWAGPERGVVCPPTVGSLCDITYYDGDPNYPRISNFRWERNKAPNCAIGEMVIQYSPSVYLKITSGVITLKAPQINLVGNVTSTGFTGGAGTVQMTANVQVNGNINGTGNIIDGGSNTSHHNH